MIPIIMNVIYFYYIDLLWNDEQDNLILNPNINIILYEELINIKGKERILKRLSFIRRKNNNTNNN
jgi:hypothetical protein